MDNWILTKERIPNQSESGYDKEYQVTVLINQHPKTLVMQHIYGTLTKNEEPHWEWRGRYSPYPVIAWKPLSAPYIPDHN